MFERVKTLITLSQTKMKLNYHWNQNMLKMGHVTNQDKNSGWRIHWHLSVFIKTEMLNHLGIIPGIEFQFPSFQWWKTTQKLQVFFSCAQPRHATPSGKSKHPLISIQHRHSKNHRFWKWFKTKVIWFQMVSLYFTTGCGQRCWVPWCVYCGRAVLPKPGPLSPLPARTTERCRTSVSCMVQAWWNWLTWHRVYMMYSPCQLGSFSEEGFKTHMFEDVFIVRFMTFANRIWMVKVEQQWALLLGCWIRWEEHNNHNTI